MTKFTTTLRFNIFFLQKRERNLFPPVGLNSNGQYVCWITNCGKEFSSAMLLMVHQYESGHLDFMCCLCNGAFSRKDILRRHIKSLHLQEHFTCLRCIEQRTFDRKDHFRKHQLQVHGSVLCEVCGEAFLETKSLKAHFIQEHS